MPGGCRKTGCSLTYSYRGGTFPKICATVGWLVGRKEGRIEWLYPTRVDFRVLLPFLPFLHHKCFCKCGPIRKTNSWTAWKIMHRDLVRCYLTHKIILFDGVGVKMFRLGPYRITVHIGYCDNNGTKAKLSQ